MTISYDRLLKVLRYCEHTGEFRWLISLSSRSVVDRLAGTLVNGYICISIDGHRYQAHHLAWLYMTGSRPKLKIDHRNGVTTDNRFSNLREATNSQNTCNSRTSSRNTTGIKGVSFDKSRDQYRARIDVNGKAIRLGRFDTIEDATVAIEAARVQYHGDFANHG